MNHRLPDNGEKCSTKKINTFTWKENHFQLHVDSWDSGEELKNIKEDLIVTIIEWN